MNTQVVFLRSFALPIAILGLVSWGGWSCLYLGETHLPIPVWGIFALVIGAFWLSYLFESRKYTKSDDLSFLSTYLKGSALRAMVILSAIFYPFIFSKDQYYNHIATVLFFMFGYICGQVLYLRIITKVYNQNNTNVNPTLKAQKTIDF